MGSCLSSYDVPAVPVPVEAPHPLIPHVELPPHHSKIATLRDPEKIAEAITLRGKALGDPHFECTKVFAKQVLDYIPKHNGKTEIIVNEYDALIHIDTTEEPFEESPTTNLSGSTRAHTCTLSNGRLYIRFHDSLDKGERPRTSVSVWRYNSGTQPEHQTSTTAPDTTICGTKTSTASMPSRSRCESTSDHTSKKL